MAEYLDIALPIAEKNAFGELVATRYFEDWIQSIVAATGGEGATIVNEVLSISSSVDRLEHFFGLVLSMKRRISSLEASLSNHIVEAAVRQLQIDTARFDTKIKTSNYTARNKDYVEARNGITVKFPGSAVRGDEVIFANGDGTRITFDGNGNDIKHRTTSKTLITTSAGSSLHFHFFEDNGLDERYWRAR
jgi:hypothetical protein